MYNTVWYETLNKPFLTPPAWVFPPMWTVLYISMLVALIFYAKEISLKKKSWGYVLFFTQLIVNFAWSPAFFGLQNIGFALALIILLDVLVLLNILEFSKISKTAGKILVPYFLWILFATYLNISFFVNN